MLQLDQRQEKLKGNNDCTKYFLFNLQGVKFVTSEMQMFKSQRGVLKEL
jgi:hypothetical protein